MNAGPRVDQAQLMVHTRSGPGGCSAGEVGVQQRVVVEQVQVGLAVHVGCPALSACSTGRSGQLIAARRCMAPMIRGRSGDLGR